MILAGLVTILLALLGAPLFVVIGASALAALARSDLDSSLIGIEMYRLSGMPLLASIPLFAFAGFVLAESGAPRRLTRLSRALLGWLPGGLAVVALAVSALFTAFTGASGVTIIALGGLLYPALIHERYGERFSLGLVTASGSLGLLFPPSLPLILYGVVSGANIDQLFLAGVLPGVLLVILLSLYGVGYGARRRLPRVRFSGRELAAALWEARYELPVPLIVLGGIYSGRFAVTDAAALTAFIILLIEVVIYRDVPLRRLPQLVRESMVLVGAILIIMGVALGYTNYLIDAEVPMKILGLIQGHIGSQLTFLLVLNIFLLIVGCMMDMFSALIVVVPLIVPLAASYGVHPVHLGIVFLANLEIGYLTPPVGLNLFIASHRFRRPVLTLYRASVPFLLILLLGLAIITYVPALSLALLPGGGRAP